jgi:hypothetical protein
LASSVAAESKSRRLDGAIEEFRQARPELRESQFPASRSTPPDRHEHQAFMEEIAAFALD